MKTAPHLMIFCLLAMGLALLVGCADPAADDEPSETVDTHSGDAGTQDPDATDAGSNATTDAPEPEPDPLFDEELTDWERINFGGEGEVRYEDGVLNLDFGGPLTGLKYTGDANKLFGENLENYEITLQAMRVQGLDFFLGLTFPVGMDGHVSLVLGGWGGAIAGLSSLDGMHAAENATTKYLGFKQKQWYSVRIRVTTEKIECWLDDEQIVDVARADYTEYDVHPAVVLSKPFGLCTYETWGAYRDLKVRELD